MLASLPSAKMGKFLTAWDEHVEPLLSGLPRKGPAKERRLEQTPREREEGEAQSILSSRQKEKERLRKSTSEKSLHSAASMRRKRSVTREFHTPEEGERGRQALQSKSKRSEQG
jgi:hypothetical protein